MTLLPFSNRQPFLFSSCFSKVTCLSCKHKSNTVEPFWDLSLEFPERYHSTNKGSGSTAYQRSCTLVEMLSKFTEMEALEGNIYACNHCNSECKPASPVQFYQERIELPFVSGQFDLQKCFLLNPKASLIDLQLVNF